MLLNQFAPQPHFVERHSIEVYAAAEEAYRAIWTTDFGTSPVLRTLMVLRTLPSRIFQRKTPLEVRRNLNLQAVIDGGFGQLAENPGREIVLGLVGRFWRPDFNLQPCRPEFFSGELPPGLVKMAWNFTVEEGIAAGAPVRVSTETRVVCSDGASRFKFAVYWALVRPFSGLIRRVMLRAIERTCRRLRTSLPLDAAGADQRRVGSTH